jgi:PmbA protein
MDFDTIKDEQLSVLDTSLKYVKSLDRSADFEIYLHYQNRIEAEINQGAVTAASGAIAGTGVRAAKSNRVGFAVASGTSVERVKLAAREALAIITSVNVEDNRFQGFAEPHGKGKEGTFSDAILSLETSDLIQGCLDLAKEAREVDQRVKVVTASADAGWQCYAIANTNGIMHASRNNNCSCSAGVYAIDGEERRHGYEFDISRERVFRTDGLGKKAAEVAVGLLGAKKLGITAKMPTVWTPLSAATYILSSISFSAVGRPVVDRISPLCDKLGDEIAAKEFSLIDDGQNPKGLGTEAVDSEGLPQKRNPVVEKGVLKTFLFDHYFGKAYGLESTGNCSRGGGLFGSSTPYEEKPTSSAKWFEVLPGRKSEEDIISSIDGNAILIRDFPIGIFHSSVETGDFSCVAISAYLVENGELKGPVEPVSVAGNYYEGLKNLLEVGNNVVSIPYGINIPTLAFDGFSIVG